ncbi:hypothetical protein [Brevibacterium album]|uniref:hypothetical protein n=1 Tax=Brevibacterium album TaxID=417948 RepID=UPI0003F75682|nr:hypothetical protein [Brevibacterium album]
MTRIAPIWYYEGRVAYPSREQLRRARQMLDLDFGDGGRPTLDLDCTHIQRLVVRGPAHRIEELDAQMLRRFRDDVGHARGLRVLTHETDRDSTHSKVTITREIVYVIESRPTRGYVKLTLKSEVPQGHPTGAGSDRGSVTNPAYDGLFSGLDGVSKRR